ncbi:helix-turn-helix protein [Kribbella orskensis]|uniref:Helix-turn-helix protein n=1 Tax=Kribbella orskensis TaxID=2512216 RepID=A0ABY2B7P9_9ACTN|nr:MULTISPECIES: pyridoxamine 5'-phosphate oxidase family protein [Kribbella]TCN29601.1 helix-turn-helix protein [Kribbella sp. VKM Ac-2500]TCO09965.1 helix-turn-helix protein [Kribbella orskensis]
MTTNDQANGGGDLGRRVRRRRGALGLTREELAARARMDPGYLARVEHAPVAMTAGALIRLADALDTTVSDLLGAIPERPPGHGRAGLRPVLTDMGEQECLALIEPGGIGRLAFEVSGRLTVVPVNFTVHHGDIVFRTAATTAIGRYGEGPVAFEVDRIDEGMHEGWSVLISGTARQADQDETAALGTTVDVDPWAGGNRELYVLITPARITGRRVRAW